VRELLAGGVDVNAPDDRETPLLWWAVQEKHHEVARLLLEAGADPNATSDGLIVLSNAVADDDVEMTELLIRAGADVNADSENGPALSLACAYESLGVARQLLAAGADVNARDDEGWTALRHAVEARNAELVRLLRAHGADPDLPDNEGKTVWDRVDAEPKEGEASADELRDALTEAPTESGTRTP
jgi:uncharacterized protein